MRKHSTVVDFSLCGCFLMREAVLENHTITMTHVDMNVAASSVQGPEKEPALFPGNSVFFLFFFHAS